MNWVCRAFNYLPIDLKFTNGFSQELMKTKKDSNFLIFRFGQKIFFKSIIPFCSISMEIFSRSVCKVLHFILITILWTFGKILWMYFLTNPRGTANEKTLLCKHDRNALFNCKYHALLEVLVELDCCSFGFWYFCS